MITEFKFDQINKTFGVKTTNLKIGLFLADTAALALASCASFAGEEVERSGSSTGSSSYTAVLSARDANLKLINVSDKF